MPPEHRNREQCEADLASQNRRRPTDSDRVTAPDTRHQRSTAGHDERCSQEGGSGTATLQEWTGNAEYQWYARDGHSENRRFGVAGTLNQGEVEDHESGDHHTE